jgi:hypothetical protein
MAYPVCDVLANYQANRDQAMRQTEGEKGVISKIEGRCPCGFTEEEVKRSGVAFHCLAGKNGGGSGSTTPTDNGKTSLIKQAARKTPSRKGS